MHPGNEAATEKPRSPGLKYRHYAPKASVTIFDGPREAVARQINAEIKIRKKEGFSVGVLATDESICYYKEVGIVVQSLGSLGDSLQQASNLFHCLRKFDDMGIDVVFAEALPRGGAGDAEQAVPSGWRSHKNVRYGFARNTANCVRIVE